MTCEIERERKNSPREMPRETLSKRERDTMCVCVCERERERERETLCERERDTMFALC